MLWKMKSKNSLSSPRRVRRHLQHRISRQLKLRRSIVGMSMIGLGAMGAVTLLQTGIVKHLPDPPIGNFHSDKVNSSLIAYQLRVPDAALAMMSLAANIPIAAFGASDRSRRIPALPVIAAAKAAVDASIAGWYFYQMPAREKAWCGYCIVGALMNAAIFFASLPEAFLTLRSR